MARDSFYRAEDAIYDADWLARQAEAAWYEEWRARQASGDRAGALDARDACRSLVAARHPLRLWLREHAQPDTEPAQERSDLAGYPLEGLAAHPSPDWPPLPQDVRRGP